MVQVSKEVKVRFSKGQKKKKIEKKKEWYGGKKMRESEYFEGQLWRF